jgi:NAD kinase
MVESWRRVGLVVNPAAGKGTNSTAATSALRSLGVDAAFTCQAGNAALSGWSGVVSVHAVEESGRAHTRVLVQWLCDKEVDAVVVIGGDGTLADVAMECCARQSRVPIIGIGTGSTNVGRLTTCCAEKAATLNLRDLETWNPDCLAASFNGELVGLAFNDVVIGNTIVGTIDNQRRDLDAAEHLRGRPTRARPRRVGGPKTRVTRIRNGVETLVAEAETVGTVVAGFAEPAFFGKAITGGICLASLAQLPAGCLVCDLPLAQIEVSAASLLNAEPISSSYVSLAEDTSIAVENMSNGAVLCVDGNPLYQLSESDRVTISVRREAIVAVRSHGNMRSP